MRPRLDPHTTAFRIGVCVEPKIRERLEDMAQAEKVKLSDVVRDLIRKGLDEYENAKRAINGIDSAR